MTEISIIVPIYNSINHLEQCIDSILDQSFRDIEVILVDDGSYDGSEKVCDEYDNKDERIKVIHQENGGLVSARKVGFMAASGKWIGFVDSDDWIEVDMYEKLYRLANDNEVDIVMCGRFEDSDYGSKKVFHGFEEGIYRRSDLEKKVFSKMIVNEYFFEWGIFPSYWDKLFKKECLKKYILQVDNRITMGEDAACIYPCLYNADSIYILKECLYHYRQTSGSMVKKTPDNIQLEREKYRILYQTVKKQFSENNLVFGLEDQWKKYLLFLMTPRADILYEGIYDLDYLFPFPEVKRGDKIVIYGAGLWGQRLYNSLSKTGFCDVVAIADQNYELLRKEGLDVISPEKIGDYKFDAIVVAASFQRTRMAILEYLNERYPFEKILGLNEENVFSDKTMQAFGLD